jgi:predicted PhzF superfamily epimerase YddE/YHI9
MKIRMYQVDAFTDKVFHGNPAAVCLLDCWLPDELMQQIAMENNLAETAFLVKEGERFRIRWFTPVTEVDLCGHATLAAGFVLFTFESYPDQVIEFDSRSGPLSVIKEGEFLTLDFPADKLDRVPPPENLIVGLGSWPLESYKGKSDYMLVFGTAEDIENLKPDMTVIAAVDARGVIVTAPGKSVDFVSRFFAPQSGIPEDPVTGSAHTSLVPYWAARFGRSELTAMQLSKRRGWLKCKLDGDRVRISGQAHAFFSGMIQMD